MSEGRESLEQLTDNIIASVDFAEEESKYLKWDCEAMQEHVMVVFNAEKGGEATIEQIAKARTEVSEAIHQAEEVSDSCKSIESWLENVALDLQNLYVAKGGKLDGQSD